MISCFRLLALVCNLRKCRKRPLRRQLVAQPEQPASVASILPNANGKEREVAKMVQIDIAQATELQVST